MYIKRKLEQKLLDLSTSFPIVLITGPRQVGKTTFTKQIREPSREYISLEALNNRIFAIDEPDHFLETHKPPVIIDEIQYAPRLLSHILAYVEKHKNYGDYWLIGSNSLNPLKSILKGIVGRVCILNLFSLSHSEISEAFFNEYTTDVKKLMKRQKAVTPMLKQEAFERILKGGMPEIYQDPPVTLQDYFDGYIRKHLFQDIKNLTQSDEISFYKFMKICSYFASKQVDYTIISKRAGIALKKAKEWITALVSSGTIMLLQPFSNSSFNKVVNTPKLYFIDSGLLCYLRGIDNATELEHAADSGDFFENYIVSEVFKSFANTGKRPQLYYYKDDNNRKEIDLVLEHNGVIYPIEIEESSNPDKRTIKSFSSIALAKKPNIRVGRGNIICNISDIYHLGEDIWAVPHWFI